MMRPVLNLAAGQLEMIGTFEQVYLDISTCAEEVIPGVSTSYISVLPQCECVLKNLNYLGYHSSRAIEIRFLKFCSISNSDA